MKLRVRHDETVWIVSFPGDVDHHLIGIVLNKRRVRGVNGSCEICSILECTPSVPRHRSPSQQADSRLDENEADRSLGKHRTDEMQLYLVDRSVGSSNTTSMLCRTARYRSRIEQEGTFPHEPGIYTWSDRTPPSRTGIRPRPSDRFRTLPLGHSRVEVHACCLSTRRGSLTDSAVNQRDLRV